jgi:hypothetical protein
MGHTVADRWALLVGAVFPQSSPALRPCGDTGKIAAIKPATCDHLRAPVPSPVRPRPRAVASSPRAV